MNIHQFVHFPTDEHLGCFQFLDIMNKAALNFFQNNKLVSRQPPKVTNESFFGIIMNF